MLNISWSKTTEIGGIAPFYLCNVFLLKQKNQYLRGFFINIS